MARAGFTLLEALVALLLLTGGLLAAAGVTTRAAGLVTQGRRATELATLALARLETFRGGPCGSPASGTARVADFELVWATGPAAGLQQLTLTVRDLQRPRVAARFALARRCP